MNGYVNASDKWLAGLGGGEKQIKSSLTSLKGLEISEGMDVPPFSTPILGFPFSLSLPLPFPAMT
jgi:hypothetical protein